MQIQKSDAVQSVEDFRAAVAASFETSGAVLLNLIEALAVGPRPGALRRLAAGLFLELEWHKPEVKPRGKSPGRAAGATPGPRTRFKVYRAEA
jgi:hypothetical protein